MPTIVGYPEYPSSDAPVETKHRLELPFIVGEHYMAEEPCSSGGMGDTFKGRDTQSDQKVIIKIPHERSDLEKRFKQECEILRRLGQETATSPNIAHWLADGEGEISGNIRPYLVMEYVEGDTLEQILTSRGHLPWKEVHKLLSDVGHALEYIHEKEICHRDIKPANIIFDRQNQRWVLVDFGISHDEILYKTILAETIEDARGSTEGTFVYMSPEQRDGEKVDIRSDIYSLGAVAWEALIGTPPTAGTKLPSKYTKGRKKISDAPRSVDVLINRMTDHDIGDRCQSPKDFLQALEGSFISGIKEQKVRMYLKLAFCLTPFAIVLACIWYIGNWVQTAGIEEVLRDTHPNVALEKVEAIHRKWGWLFWGDKKYKEEIEELKQKADAERDEMLEEYGSLLKSTDKDSKEQWLETAGRFIKKYKEGPLGKSFEYDEINKRVLEELKQKADAERDEMLEEYGSLLKSTDKDSKEQWLETAGRFIKKYKEGPLGKSSEYDEINKRVLFLRAFSGPVSLDSIKEMNKGECGKLLDQLRIAEKKYPDRKELWEVREELSKRYKEIYGHEFRESITKNDLTATRKVIEELNELGDIVERSFIDVLKKKLTSLERNKEWEETEAYINQTIETKDFPAAKRALDRFGKKYPGDDKIIYLIGQNIAAHWLNYVRNQAVEARDERKDPLFYDDYKQSMDAFMNSFSEKEYENYVKQLEKGLFYLAQDKLLTICSWSQGNIDVIKSEIERVKWEKCNDTHSRYLIELKKLILDYIEQPSAGSRLKVRYVYERIRGIEPNKYTVYKVHFVKVRVHFSDTYYAALKGLFNADPIVEIGRYSADGQTYDSLIRRKGPVNQKDFEIELNGDFYSDKSLEFVGKVIDDDYVSTGSIELKCAFDPSRTSIRLYNPHDGTYLDLYYTAE